MRTLSNPSFTVTVPVASAPALTSTGNVITNCARPTSIVTVAWHENVLVDSAAVTICGPALSRRALYTREPRSLEGSKAEAGESCARASLEVSCTTPAKPVETLSNKSYTVTRSGTCEPAGAVAGNCETAQDTAPAAATVKLIEPDGTPLATVSPCAPAVLNVTWNPCWPASAGVNVYTAGRSDFASVELKVTAPRKAVAVFAKPSYATTVTSAGAPAVAVTVPCSAKVTTSPGSTVIWPVDPDNALSVTEIDPAGAFASATATSRVPCESGPGAGRRANMSVELNDTDAP